MKDKFNSLAWYFQLLILVGVASLLYTGVWYFVTSSARAEVQTLNEQIAQLEAQNNAARVATQRINEFRTLYATKEVEYDELKILLPEQREITNVLQGLNDTAKESRLIVQRFSPQEDTQQESLMAKPVQVEVDSNFNNLRVFFERMAKLSRIVSITDFKLNQLTKQSAARTLHAQFTLTAYYATPEDLTAPKPAPGKPGEKGKDKKGADKGAPPPDGKKAPAPPNKTL
ncbi:MAG: type 4a pilus biogenesis protein PilO [Pyrinomonadaceae bacterium]|nr:type 4a pilus biogenesis protein PilO [Pyrinomonadaceae bacterium]